MIKINNNIIKKMIYVIAAVLMTLAFTAGTAVAFFTDSEETVNRFTVGDVEIKLDEPNWDVNEGKDITPEKVIKKDPVVTNTGANPAYIFAKVVVPKADVVISDKDGVREEKAVRELFTYNINSGWTEIAVTEGSVANEHIYAYGTETEMTALEKNAKTNTLFDSVQFINIVEGQIDGTNIELPVTAYAIQTSDIGKTKPSDIYQIIINGTTPKSQE